MIEDHSFEQSVAVGLRLRRERRDHGRIGRIDFSRIDGLPGRVVGEDRDESDESRPFGQRHVLGGRADRLDPEFFAKVVGRDRSAAGGDQVQHDQPHQFYHIAVIAFSMHSDFRLEIFSDGEIRNKIKPGRAACERES